MRTALNATVSSLTEAEAKRLMSLPVAPPDLSSAADSVMSVCMVELHEQLRASLREHGCSDPDEWVRLGREVVWPGLEGRMEAILRVLLPTVPHPHAIPLGTLAESVMRDRELSRRFVDELLVGCISDLETAGYVDPKGWTRLLMGVALPLMMDSSGPLLAVRLG